jgi:hypothetical protein
MSNERGWKDGVYNPGFNHVDTLYIARKAREFREAGYEFPEIKGVQFKRTKNQHKPLRNTVSRVVMVGFDPFNHSGLPEHIERQVVHDYWSGLEMQFVQDWVNEAPEGEIRIGSLLNLYGDDTNYKPFPELSVSSEEHSVDFGLDDEACFDYMFRSDRVVENGIVKRDKHGPSGIWDIEPMDRKHNPILTVRENFQLDAIRARKDSDPVISEIGLLTGVIPETYEDGPVPIAQDLYNRLKVGGHLLPNGNVDLSGTFHWDHRIFESNLCPEVEVVESYLFQHAGHVWKHTHSNFHNIGITGVVELYVPGENAELEYLVQGKTHQYEVAPPGRGSRIAEFVDLTYATSQSVGRNETMAYMVVDRSDHVFDPIMMEAPLTPEELSDREAAIKEAQEGGLDYLLEGTQWDPRNRK